MSATKYYLDLLSAIGERAHEEPKNLADAAPVVTDLGRLISRGSAADVRSVMAGAAALRTRLMEGTECRSAADQLKSHEALSFLAGALWALEEAAETRVTSFEEAPKATSVTRRETVRLMVLDLIGWDPISPSELLDAPEVREAGLRPDEVSRAIGALADAGELELVSPPTGGDRRRKFYKRVAA